MQHVGRQEQVTFAIPNNRWYYYGLSPDGRHLAVAIWGMNWDEDDFQLHQSLPVLGPLLHQREKPRAWVSTVYLYETTEGTLRRSLRGFPSIATHLVFRPDGRQLFVGGGQTATHSNAWTDNPTDMGGRTAMGTSGPLPRRAGARRRPLRRSPAIGLPHHAGRSRLRFVRVTTPVANPRFPS